MDNVLRIRSNYYKRPGSLEGNGLYESYAEGEFSNGERFLVYPLFGVFYLEVDNLIIKKKRIEVEDLVSIQSPEKWLKYAKELLDSYASERGLTYRGYES